ncbi:hypothetical protein ACFOY4_40910 [Actinomadura syzygii]|uniref:Uncharacterized protein n=1 Tax=Actinomadura syzygii TaxID=1427538 RepID=A0A5D0U9L4_9ACTN|nr:hypothetical protein [Actinomadura syzygii]TYC14694.1 hypothetical protein FXF65_17895 [Actinomadura syzygii]
MGYEVEFWDAETAQQTIPLSTEDYESLNTALRAAARDPFDPAHSKGTPDVHVRRVRFGVHVRGAASVFVDPQAKKLRVFDVRWKG